MMPFTGPYLAGFAIHVHVKKEKDGKHLTVQVFYDSRAIVFFSTILLLLNCQFAHVAYAMQA